MKLYLDDDTADPLLARLLAKDGHDVQLPRHVNLAGSKDPEHLIYTVRSRRVLLTHNHRDYELLHALVIEVGGHHPGILTVGRENNPKRDLKPAGIVRVIANLVAAGIPIENELHVLNHWR